MNKLDFFPFFADMLNNSFFFSSRRRHTRLQGDWSSDVCSSDLYPECDCILRSGARVATNRKRVLVPSVMGAGGRRLLDARDDVEVVAFATTISAADFHTLLRSGGEVHGAILGLTRFGETECALARGLGVVARIGVGYDAIDVPALTRRRVPLM